jgi:hypothetical protein
MSTMKVSLLRMGNAALREYVAALETETRVLRLEGRTDLAVLADAELALAAQEVVRRIVRGELSLLA